MNEPQRKIQFQFTLRRLLIAIALVGVLLALCVRPTIDYRKASFSAKAISRLGGTVSWDDNVFENLWEVQNPARITDIRFYSTSDFGTDAQAAMSQLPHPFGLHLEGQTFGPDVLPELAEIRNLNYLVFSDTQVKERDVTEFQKARPDVYVMFGYPGDTGFREFPSSD